MWGKFLAMPALAAAIACATPASATEHVINGGFETGNFTGWTLTGNTGFTGVDNVTVHSGSFAGSFGQVGSTGSLSQSLSTVAGQMYTVSFWLGNDGGATSSFSAAFGGDTLLSLSDPSSFGYTLYTYDVTASSGSTLLDFTFRQDPAFFHLDDISVRDVSSVPEPATWAMMILGMGAVGFALRRRTPQAAASLA
jgi:hypothetical protein